MAQHTKNTPMLFIKKGSPIDDFHKSVHRLSSTLKQDPGIINVDRDVSNDVHRALDGNAYKALSETFERSELRKHGIFFTGSHLSEYVATIAARSFTKSARILDPTCGGADLLIASARAYLRKFPSYGDTPGLHICGYDLIKSFVELARARMKLLQLYLSNNSQSPCLTMRFHTKDAFDSASTVGFTHIVMNPPFNMIHSPDPRIGRGTISAAAAILSHYLEIAAPGTRLVAILPESLLSGTRYKKWRRFVSGRAEIREIVRKGQFSKDVDIDVFVLELLKRRCVAKRKEENLSWQTQVAPVPSQTIGQIAQVNVGSVVPHRDPNAGDWHPYITAQSIPRGGEIVVANPKRRFKGRTFLPPFVVVRRTSRPGQVDRAKPTVVKGSSKVAVENHLIVITPNDSTLATCRRISDSLSNAATPHYLDRTIRCRHLTVKSIAELPIW